MFRTAILALYLFWFMDILDMPFMKEFDTTYPLNGWFWVGTLVLSLIVSEIPVLYKESREG